MAASGFGRKCATTLSTGFGRISEALCFRKKAWPLFYGRGVSENLFPVAAIQSLPRA